MDNPHHCALFIGMEFDTDIAIVGGGLNGPVLALALAHAGFSVTVIDAQPRAPMKGDNFDGRSYALALSSARLLEALGLWQIVAPDAQPMLEIKISDGRAGEGPSPFFIHFDHAEIEEGPMGHMVEDRHLRRALLDAVEANDRITLRSETTVVAQSPDPAGMTLALDGGENLRARLCVGADGRGTGVGLRAGIRRTGHGYGQTALVCAIAHEKPHGGVAHQFFMPPGPLAILPLTGNRSSIVWSESDKEAARIINLPDEAFLEVLRPRFGDFLGDISLAGARYTYPLSLSLAHEMVADRVALVGDAAHGLHPIAGQGLNAGFRDIAALAEVLTEAKRRGEDIGNPLALARYQEWRRFDNTALAIATDAFNKLFSNDNSMIRALRDVGMGIVGKVPALRRGFIREAAGLSGELPRLMRGEPL